MYDYRFENKFYILLVFRLFVIGANVTAANVTQLSQSLISMGRILVVFFDFRPKH